MAKLKLILMVNVKGVQTQHIVRNVFSFIQSHSPTVEAISVRKRLAKDLVCGEKLGKSSSGFPSCQLKKIQDSQWQQLQSDVSFLT